MIVAGRVLRAIFSLWVIVTLVFVALRMTGDPILAIFDPDDTTAEAIQSYRELWGYTGTTLEQYLRYVAAIADGNFGFSSMNNRPAQEVVMERVPATLLLVGASTAIMFLIAFPSACSRR
jgi:peptide/nickel transport system permease protein